MNPINSLFTGTGPLVLFLAKATVLLVGAIVAMIPLRRSTAGARHLVWLAALVGVLALPLLSRVQPIRLGVLPHSLGGSIAESPSPLTPAIAPVPNAPSRIATASLPAPARLLPAPAPRAYAAPVVSGAPAMVAIAGTPAAVAPRAGGAFVETAVDSSSILTVVAIVWAGVAFALVGWLVAGALSVRRIVTTGTDLTAPEWTTPLCEVADRLDLELPPRLVMSDRIEMAFACRALMPTIVLPASAASWTDDRRRAVLFHELAHVKRHDLLGHTLGRLACALYWFHPLVWTAAKNLRNESERACDDLVLSCGARPSEYAQHLLDMVTSVRNHGAPVMALPMARKKEFEGRMLAILDPAIRRASPGRAQAAGVVATIALLSITVAAVSPATASPAVSPPAIAPRAGAPTPTPTPSPMPRARPRLAVANDTGPDVVSSQSQSTSTSTSESASMSTSISTSSPVQAGMPFVPGTFVEAIARTAANAAGAALSQAGREITRELQGGKRGDTTRVALLIQILGNDADPSVRRTAAWGLNDLQTSSISPALIKALKQDAESSVREMAAWSLAQHQSEGVAGALADALLHDKSSRVRATAAWALGEIEARQESSAIESALVDPDADVRFAAIWALGQMNLRTAPRGMTTTLTDASQNVRLVTAWALGEIEDKATAPAVVTAFQTETDVRVRSAELRALAAMGQATPSVVDVALKSNDPELRRRAVAMLAGSDAGVWVWPWPWPRPRPSP
jgi:beta-lactamase regulating signal transducer with metallopeptidase domain/HEAT repeat protein